MSNMANTTLAQYASGRLKGGDSPEEIKSHLTLVGWTEEEASEAVVAGLLASGVPAPERGASKGGGRVASTVEVVLNFFSFILLGTVATALGVLYFNIINKYFPDALSQRYGYDLGYSASAVQYSIATLVIAFPIYVATVSVWFRRFREDAEKAESKLTKWLTYLVLLAASVTIVGDLIAAVLYFLQGELSVRFLLKSGTILLIAGMIFGFYFLERKKIQYKEDVARDVFRGFGWAVTVYVIIGVVLGFFVAGSPATQRSRTFDQTRAENLRSIASCVSEFTQINKRLPEDLSELTTDSRLFYCYSQGSDPETGVAYGYSAVSQPVQSGEVRIAIFELCADFTLSDSDNSADASYAYAMKDKWSEHAAGHSCDTETVTINEENISRSVPKGAPLPVTPIVVQ
jgi:hypothetical protein